MEDIKKISVSPSTSILKTLEVVDQNRLSFAAVVSADFKLLGVVTDGNVRRAILKGISLQSPIEEVMNKTPVTVSPKATAPEILKIMQAKKVRQIPVVDASGVFVALKILEDLLEMKPRDTSVILMAGGTGSRLKPLTDDCPKPLLPIGNKPLLETIVKNFTDKGFHKFFISVNYKAEMIQNHFGDGSRFDAEIEYLTEGVQTGTAGSLSLLPKRPDKPFIVMNGDILTNINFGQLLDFHTDQKAEATLCVRDYEFQVPYGVVELDRERVVKIEEKPVHHFFVNAGVYVFEPSVIELIPRDRKFDMTELIKILTDQKRKTVAFPIREYWMDIGQLSDFERAKTDFLQFFQ